MVFSSIIFIWIFLPTVLLLYYVFPKLQNYTLLVASLFFYFWGGPQHFPIILISILINYLFGLLIHNTKKMRRVLLMICIICNLGILFYFKYLAYLITLFNAIFHTEICEPSIALPIGISFFTFQGLTYVIDLYRGEVKVQKNVLKVALYIALFPQLIAGPIVRYKAIENEIDYRKTNINDIATGIRRFILGLGKKVILANTLAAVADEIFNYSNYSYLSTGTLWLGAVCYTMQIYFDFSGYSDMAIGLGKMLGFTFPENFNLPYISKSITEFWRRWHISLSSFFKDYLYIPLGGSRKGNVYLNLFIVFIATGIWHGASITFWAWGLFHGMFIVMERYLTTRKFNMRVPNIIKHVYTLFVVIIGWVFFRCEDMNRAVEYIKYMFTFEGDRWAGFSIGYFLNDYNVFVIALSLILAFGGGRIIISLKNKVNIFIYNASCLVGYMLLMLFLMVRILTSTYDPFIYFRF